jgi:hypothetical protein
MEGKFFDLMAFRQETNRAGLDFIVNRMAADLLGLNKSALHGDQITFVEGVRCVPLKMRAAWPAWSVRSKTVKGLPRLSLKRGADAIPVTDTS